MVGGQNFLESEQEDPWRGECVKLKLGDSDRHKDDIPSPHEFQSIDLLKINKQKPQLKMVGKPKGRVLFP